MPPRLVAVVALAACGGHDAVDDCTLVREDLARAMPRLAVRYPANPVRVAETVERCVAPPGPGIDDCQRLDRLVRAMPDLLRGTAGASAALASRAAALASSADLVEVCRGMPAELRPCLLPSWTLAHPDACQKVHADLASQARSTIDIPAHAAPAAPDCEPAHLVLRIGRAGVWLGSDRGVRCFAPRTGPADAGGAAGAAGGGAAGAPVRAIDAAWLEGELRSLAVGACPPAVEIAGAPGVVYQDVIHAFDIAVKVGLSDPGLTLPRELAIQFSDATQAAAPSHCTAQAASPDRPAATPAPDTSTPPSPAAHERLAIPAAVPSAPVIVVTRQDVSLRGVHVASVAEVAAGEGLLAPLTRALAPRPTDPTIILQADKDTDMTVINRIVQTASHAGYTAMLFAVKNH